MYLLFVLIIQESSFTMLSRCSTGNLTDIFKDLPRLVNKIQGLSRTKKFKTFPEYGNPANHNSIQKRYLAAAFGKRT